MKQAQTKDPKQKAVRNLIGLISVCMVGAILVGAWLKWTPPGLQGKLVAVGYAVCHQIASHSFAVEDEVLPLCARCTGMYLGALFGLVVQFLFGKKRGGYSIKALVCFGVLTLWMVVDGINSFASLAIGHSLLYTPHNWARLITGLGAGFLIAAIVFPLFTQTLSKEWRSESTLDAPLVFTSLFLIGAVITVSFLMNIGWAMLVFAFLSVMGVLLVLSLIYTILIVSLFRLENGFQSILGALPILISGFLVGIMQIGTFDMVRFLLTNTWNRLTF